MPRTILLIALIIGIGVVGFGIYFVSTPGYLIESHSPEYPGLSEIPLYEGDSSPKEIPPYENDATITPVEPNK